MSNQTILWSMLIIPWLTLFFMNREDLKYFMPVAFFTTLTATIIHETGLTLGLWIVQETIFPFSYMMPFVYGTIPVLTLWIFRFTYGRFWVYMVVNAIFDVGFAYFFLNNFLPSKGIYTLVDITSFQLWLVNLAQAVLIYGYQIWQEGVFARPKRASTFARSKLQPAAVKPLSQNEDNKTDKE